MPESTVERDSTNRLERRFERIIVPFGRFVQNQTTASVLLIIGALTALVLANSPWADDYYTAIHIPIGIHIGDFGLEKPLQHWVNECLMALFFFVLGLEIKRECLVGALRDLRHASLLILTALGGMAAPALIYLFFNADGPAARGWGIPMATDTAFALGVLALIGRRLPRIVTTFLVALAIADDIGAVLVIALFYNTEQISVYYLAASLSLVGLLALCNRLGISSPVPYFLGGGLVWLTMLESGVHATISGILVAFTVPARPKPSPSHFLHHIRELLERFEDGNPTETDILADHRRHALVESMQDTVKHAGTPLKRWEQAWTTLVSLLVLPIFALSNAGIPLKTLPIADALLNPVTLGIMLGLVAGKLVGITGACYLALRLRLGRLPPGLTPNHIVGIGLLGGLGFTMSIFIAGLGVAEAAEQLVMAKAGILLGSLVAGLTGYLWLRFNGHRSPAKR